MNTTKVFLIFVLALVMVCSVFIGCTKKPEDDTEKTEEKVESKATETKEETTEKVEAVDNELYEFTVMADFIGEMSQGELDFFDNLEKALNIKLDYYAPPVSAYTESLQIMLASGDYPELTLFNNHLDKAFYDAAEGGVYIALNDYLGEDSNLIKYSYPTSINAMKVLGDERIFGIPRTSIARADGYFMRADWMRTLGYDVKSGDYLTLDEFYKITSDFTNGDPDGNGIDDTYGIWAAAGGNTLVPILLTTFGLNGWQKYDGEYMDLKYSREHDNFKNCLEYNAKLFAEKVIDPDWPINNSKEDTRFMGGIDGVMQLGFAGSLPYYNEAGQKLNPDFEFVWVPGIIETASSEKKFGSGNQIGFFGCYSVSNTAEKPERVVAMLEWLLSDEGWDTVKYGIEGSTYEVKDGVKYGNEQYSKFWRPMSLLRRNNDPSFFVSIAATLEEREQVEGLLTLSINQCIISLDAGYRAPIKSDTVFADYENYLEGEMSKIIVGEEPVEYWDELLDGWYEAGGDTYIEQTRAYIEANN